MVHGAGNQLGQASQPSRSNANQMMPQGVGFQAIQQRTLCE